MNKYIVFLKNNKAMSEEHRVEEHRIKDFQNGPFRRRYPPDLIVESGSFLKDKEDFMSTVIVKTQGKKEFVYVIRENGKLKINNPSYINLMQYCIPRESEVKLRKYRRSALEIGDSYWGKLWIYFLAFWGLNSFLIALISGIAKAGTYMSSK